MGSRANRAGNNNSNCRRAYGCGRGFGYGRNFSYVHEAFRPTTPDEERSHLEALARDMEEKLNWIRERIEKLRPQA
jgi:hypothetical protein